MSKTTKLYAITILLCTIVLYVTLGLFITSKYADAIDGNETLQHDDAERRGKGVC